LEDLPPGASHDPLQGWRISRKHRKTWASLSFLLMLLEIPEHRYGSAAAAAALDERENHG
jgi:hypothetical protein